MSFSATSFTAAAICTTSLLRSFASITILALTLFCTSAHAQFWKPVGPAGGPISDLFTNEAGWIFAQTYGDYYARSPGTKFWRPVPLPSAAGVSSNARLYPGANGLFYLHGCCDLYYSTDGGSSWELRYSFNDTLSRGSSFFVDAGTRLYLARGAFDNLLYSSTNAGMTWELTGGGYADSVILITSSITSLVTNGSDLYATSTSGLLRWNGTEWLPAGPDYDGIDEAAFDGKTIVILKSNSGQGIYISRDDGVNWSLLTDERRTNLVLRDGFLWGFLGNGIDRLAVDGGAWERVIATGFAGTNLSFRFIEDDVVLGLPQGVFLWDGATLQSISDGIFRTPIRYLATIGDSVLAFSYRSLYTSSFNLTDWSVRDIPIWAAIAVDEQSIYSINATDFALFRSTNTGESWDTIGTPSGPGFRLSLSVSGDRILIGGSHVIYRSEDRGQSWRPVILPTAGSVISIAGEGDNLVCQVTGSMNQLFWSSDGGAAWQPSTLQETITNIRDITYRNGTFWLGCDAGLFKSTDGGIGWENVPVTSSNTDETIRRVESIGLSGDWMLIYGFIDPAESSPQSGRLFFSDRNDSAWREITPPGDHITSYLRLKSKLVVATEQHGLLEADLSTVSVQLPATANERRQNVLIYNPATDQLTVRLGTGLTELRGAGSGWNPVRTSDYRIELFSMSGEFVKTIETGGIDVGEQTIRLQSNYLASGSYFCRLQIDGSVASILPIVIAR